jgi:hypothetical protein
MELDTFCFDRTPLISPKVSYKVWGLAHDLSVEKIWNSFRIADHFPPTKKTMYIVISTGANHLEELEVFGPIKKRGRVEFILWIPYNRLVEHENHLKPYLKYYFDGMVQIFAHYGVPENAIREVQQIVENEVIDNPDYAYQPTYEYLDDLSRKLMEEYSLKSGKNKVK